MRMKKLLTFLTLLTLFFATGWAESYTITFGNNSSSVTALTSSVNATTVISSGTDYVTAKPFTVNSGNCYYGDTKTCIRLSKSGNSSSLSIALSSLGTVNATSIIVNCNNTGGSNNSNATLNVNSTGAQTTTTTVSDYSFSLNGNSISSITLDASASIKIYSITVNYTTSGDTPQPKTYSVNVGNMTNGNVTASATSNLSEGDPVTLIIAPDNGYKLESLIVDNSNVTSSVNNNQYTFSMPAHNVEVSATFTEQQSSSNSEWVLTDIDDLVNGDIILIVDKASSKALSSENGTSNAPPATSVTLNEDKSKVTDGVVSTTQWVFSNYTDNTVSPSKTYYQFKKIGSTTDYLYCTNSNDGVRVGTNSNRNFSFEKPLTGNATSYYFLKEKNTSRYVGTYLANTEWRCYTSVNSNIENTRVAFYKKVETGTHSVSVGTITGEGAITSSSSSANAGDQITVTATPATGYELTALAYNGTAIDITSTPYTFTMPDADVTLTATFSKIDYTITKGSMTNGTVNVAATANYGDVVTITPEPATDYVVDKVYYNDGTDHEIAVNNNAYTFTMPASNVTVWATFVEYYPTLRLAGRFNGRSTSSWVTDNSGPEFTYDTSTEKYTIDAYFIGASQDEGSDVDFFYLRSDDNDLKADADGNCWVAAEGGTYTLGGSSNFRIYPGVYNITVNKARTSITFTKITPAITFSPNGGEVEAGQSVTVTSNLQSLVDAIKTTFDSGAQVGTVSAQVSTDQNTWSDNVTLNTIGTQTVYGRAFLGNIYATGNAAYNVVAANTSTQYQLITSTDDLIAGKKYIIVSTGSYTASGTTYNFTKAAGAPNAANNLILDADVTISDEIVDLDGISGVTEFTLGGSTGKWTFAFGDGTYLASSAAKSAKADVTATPASISFNGNEATINMGSVGSFQYNPNNGNGRFAAYTSTQKPVMLFKQVEGTVTQKSAAPVITPESGNIVGYSQEVEITQANGGTIYYTTDGTTPTETSTQYDGKFWAEGANLGDEVTITAVAKEEGKELSNPVSVTYKFVAPVAPVFTPAGGTYTTAQEVSITSTTEGADVYYTTTAGLSAAQIVAQGTKFTTAINVSEETTYYAVTVYHDAHANRDALSSVRQAQYKFSEVESVDIPYERPFTDNTFGEFTIYDESNPDEIEVWTLDGTYGAKGTAYDGSSNHAATSWLISPWINMADAYNPTLKFNHTVNKYFSNPKNDATVWIRTYGGEWTQLTTQLPTSASGWVHFDEEYDLSEYSGLIQVGFKYVSTTSKAGTWEIKNFVVSSEKIATPEFNPAAGAYLNEDYPNGLNVELTCSDENVTIWYSTDGVNYSQYSSPINITETTTVYAYSMLDGHKSDVVSANYRLADYVVNDVVFSPASGTYYGDQTVQMFSTTKGVRIYYTTDCSEPSMENGTLYTGEVTINAPGTYQFKAIAYIGSEPSGVSSVDYTLNERSTGSYLLHNVNELNTHELDSDHDYQMVNPVQVIFMSTYQNNGYQPEYCLVRDNTGYGMIYFGKQNTYHNNFAKFNMGDWIKGGYSGPITCFNDPNKPGLSDTHPELGSSSRQSEQIHSWSSNLYMSNSPVLPEYLTIPEILASENEGATDYWGHYVHLRKTTIQLIQSDDPGTYTTGQDKDGKWSGSITDEDGNVINYYDKFYLQYDKNWTTTNNDFTNHPRRTFDVYGFVSCYLYADVHYQISPFAFAWIDKPTITVSGGEQTVYAEPQTITLTSPDDPTATLWYKTSEMDDFAKYIPGTTVITVSSTTTIQTYATKMSDFNDELESLVEEVTLTFTTINPPVIAPESGVYKTTDDPVDATITRDSSDGLTNVTIWFTVDGSDPADATNEKRYEYTEANIAEYLTGIDETTTVRAIAQSGSVYSAEAEPRTYTFVKSNGIEYTLITDETQLNENSVYIIVNKANNMALGINQDANHRDAVGVAFKEGTNKAIVYGNDDVAQFTLHSVLASDHIWAFQTNNSNVNGYLYVGANEDNTLLTESEQDTHGNAAAQVLIDETGTDHAATIKFTYEGATDRYMRYYNRNQLFNTYRTVTTSTDDVYIYGVEATPLATIEKEGEKDKQYTIADELIVVHTTVDGDNVLLWAKDQGNVSIAKTEKKDGQIDYMMEVAKEQREPWDQSNWVIIKTTPGSNNVDKMLEIKDHYLKPAMVTGEYSDDVNYTITIPVNEHGIAVIPDNAIGEQVEVPYNKNIYCTANFLPDNLNLTEESTGAEGHANNNTETIYYFFMNPKVQEVFTVTYAVWDGSKFVVPEADGTSNDSEIPGAFNVDWTYNSVTEGAAPSALTVNEAYRFTATVARKSIADYSVTPKATSSSPSEALTVYPLDLNPTPDNGQIVTAINNVGYTDGGHEVKSIKYVNVAGIVSDHPFQGVNIVVTEYTDGTRTTSKMLRK